MTLHDDRFDHEGDTRVDEWTRLEYGEKVAKLDALREKFMLEAAAFAAGVQLLDPNFIERRESCTGWRVKSATIPEQIAGFLERVNEQAGEFLDNGEVERLRLIAETGRDDS